MPNPGARTGTMVFHHPAPLRAEPGTGSQIRPVRMRDAFVELGYEVIEITGHSKERIPQMSEVARQLRMGRSIDFCYAENVNSPTALSDPSHLPLHPLADPRFFRSLRRAGVATGLFYRDIYWRFDEYRAALSPAKWLAATAFHRFDLAWYSRFIDVIFLPDLGMAAPIPRADRFRFHPLPPGSPVDTAPHEQDPGTHSADGLDLMYVGAVSPPHYDITPLLEAVADVPAARLTVCCPSVELPQWEQYPSRLRSDVELVHLSGPALTELYQRSDVACLIFGENPYRDFAMPVKLFEAIGHHTPCLSSADTAAGRFVADNGFGWTFEDRDELVGILERLACDPAELETMRASTEAGASQQTWTARARTVADLLAPTP